MKTIIKTITAICLISICSAQSTQKPKDEILEIAGQQPDIDALHTLRNIIDKANEDMQQVLLIVVNQGDNEHLMINDKKIQKNKLNEYFLDLNKTCGKKLPIILIDCGDKSKIIFDLIEPLAISNLIESVILNYADARQPSKTSIPHAPAEQAAPFNR